MKKRLNLYNFIISLNGIFSQDITINVSNVGIYNQIKKRRFIGVSTDRKNLNNDYRRIVYNFNKSILELNRRNG